MIPIVVRLIPSYMLINKLKLLNTYVGQILPLTAWSIPFGTFLMRQFIASVPVQLDEAAKIDGCGDFKIFLRIIIHQFIGRKDSTGTCSYDQYIIFHK